MNDHDERPCDAQFGYPGDKPHVIHNWDASVQDHAGAPWRTETFICPGVEDLTDERLRDLLVRTGKQLDRVMTDARIHHQGSDPVFLATHNAMNNLAEALAVLNRREGP